MTTLNTYTETAATVRVGDIITDGLVSGRAAKLDRVTVTSRKAGDKYMVWTVAELDTNVRVPLADEFTVLREEKTQDERDAERLQRALEDLRSDLEKGLREYDITSILAREAEAGSKELSYSTMSTIMENQSIHRVYRSVQRLLDLEDFDGDIIEAFARVIAQGTQPRGYRNSPMSRSTATMSNLMEDTDRWAFDKVLHDIEFSSRGLVAARINELHGDRGW